MATGAGSPPLDSFFDDLSEDCSINPTIRLAFEALSLTCSDVQILLLATAFRRHSNRQILRWTEEFRLHCESRWGQKTNSFWPWQAYGCSLLRAQTIVPGNKHNFNGANQSLIFYTCMTLTSMDFQLPQTPARVETLCSRFHPVPHRQPAFQIKASHVTHLRKDYSLESASSHKTTFNVTPRLFMRSQS
jgi:hypothetical protein